VQESARSFGGQSSSRTHAGDAKPLKQQRRHRLRDSQDASSAEAGTKAALGNKRISYIIQNRSQIQQQLYVTMRAH
jgi:hypothetical protein